MQAWAIMPSVRSFNMFVKNSRLNLTDQRGVMCGAYGLSIQDAKDVYARFQVVNHLDDWQARYNLCPGQLHPVITSHSPNRISRMFWGLIPHWAKDETRKYSTINAKAETAAELATYRESFRHQRCIVPATGFYEPDKIHYKKQPFPWHYFRLTDQPLFGFAGLYDICTDKQTGKDIWSYTIITTVPNEIVGQYHDRMPVILEKELEEEWLNADLVDVKRISNMLKPYLSENMEEWRVGDEARNPKNDYPEVMKPIRSEDRV
jgi:putative SOS response-associated peptidase YedK